MKNPRENQVHNDAMRAVINTPDDPKIKFLLDATAIADGIRPTTNPRVCSLTSDTAKFLARICRRAVDQLNRGSLVLPQNHSVQWCIYCFVLFTQIGKRVSRTF